MKNFIWISSVVFTTSIGSQNYQDKIQHLEAAEADLYKAVNLLDRYIEVQYAKIPNKISSAFEAKMTATQESNHRYGQVALAIIGGRAIRNLAVVLGAGTGGLSLAATLGIIGTFTDSAGYSAARAVLVEDPVPSCGLSNWEEALSRYPVLFNLRQAFSTSNKLPSYNGNTGSGYANDHSLLPASSNPNVLLLMADRLEKEIKSGLGCLLDGKSLLDRCINNLLDTIRKRISVTEELLETKQKLNTIKQNTYK